MRWDQRSMKKVSCRNNIAVFSNCNTISTKSSNVTEDGIEIVAGIEKAFGRVDYNEQAEIEWNRTLQKVEAAVMNKRMAEVGLLPDWAVQVELGLYRRKPRESLKKI